MKNKLPALILLFCLSTSSCLAQVNLIVVDATQGHYPWGHTAISIEQTVYNFTPAGMQTPLLKNYLQSVRKNQNILLFQLQLSPKETLKLKQALTAKQTPYNKVSHHCADYAINTLQTATQGSAHPIKRYSLTRLLDVPWVQSPRNTIDSVLSSSSRVVKKTLYPNHRKSGFDWGWTL